MLEWKQPSNSPKETHGFYQYGSKHKIPTIPEFARFIGFDRDATNYWVSSRNVVETRDAKSGDVRKTLKVESSLAMHTLSQNCELIASVDQTNHSIKLWKANTGERVAILAGHQQTVRAIAFAISRKIVISASFDSTIRIWSTENGEPVKTLTFEGRPIALAVSPDQRLLAVGYSELNKHLHLRPIHVQRSQRAPTS
jgi:WD40 repeat protein